jgi:outer membrane receptor for Fe3+-dicitrate
MIKAICTVQSALIAGMNAKFHSGLTKIGQFTARHVGQRGDPLDRHISLGLRDYTRNPWHTRASKADNEIDGMKEIFSFSYS